MVMGGSDSQERIEDVELVSLDPANNPVPECLKNLASLPLKANGAAAGMTSGKEIMKSLAEFFLSNCIFLDGFPLICGGSATSVSNIFESGIRNQSAFLVVCRHSSLLLISSIRGQMETDRSYGRGQG